MSDDQKRPNISDEDAEKLLKLKQKRIENERQQLIEEEEERKRKATEAELSGANNDKLTSLGKSNMVKEKEQRRVDAHEAIAEIGWKTFPIINLPSRGDFYPNGTAIQIRS